MEQVRKLHNVFKRKGLNYRLEKRNQHVAIFAVGGHNFPFSYHYEVIRIMHLPAREVYGKKYPPCESVPGDELFGKEGSKVFNTMVRAERYFHILTRRISEKAVLSLHKSDNSTEMGMDATKEENEDIDKLKSG